MSLRGQKAHSSLASVVPKLYPTNCLKRHAFWRIAISALPDEGPETRPYPGADNKALAALSVTRKHRTSCNEALQNTKALRLIRRTDGNLDAVIPQDATHLRKEFIHQRCALAGAGETCHSQCLQHQPAYALVLIQRRGLVPSAFGLIITAGTCPPPC